MKYIPTTDVKIAGVKIQLDGKMYVIPPLSLNSIQKLGDRLGKFNGGANVESVELVIDSAYMALKRNYPDMDREWLGENIDLGNMMDVMQSCMDVSGLRRKLQEDEQESGEATTNP